MSRYFDPSIEQCACWAELSVSPLHMDVVIRVLMARPLKGHGDNVTVSDVYGACDGQLGRDAFDLVCEELERFKLIRIEPIWEPKDGRIHIEKMFYQRFDPIYRGTNPIKDAKRICQYLINRHGLIEVKQVQENLHWSARRFVPAIQIILEHLPHTDNRFSTTSRDLLRACIRLGRDERHCLKTIIES